MSSRTFLSHGLDAESGGYALPPLAAEQVSALARRAPLDETSLKDLQEWLEQREAVAKGTRDGIDPRSLAASGWGVIFASAEPAERVAALRDALAPLLAARRDEAASEREHYFQEYSGARGYQPGDTARKFLDRHGVGPDSADPELMPYYLLIVGDPEAIPYTFQYQLGVTYAVGRLHFDTLEEYAAYARRVAAAEGRRERRQRRLAVFAPEHPDDAPTVLVANQLAAPLAAGLAERHPGWRVSTALGDDATKPRLVRLLGGEETPDLLFTVGHGLQLRCGNPRQATHQGALVCREWPGPKEWHGPIPDDFVFAAQDLDGASRLDGLVTFHFACHSAGVPAFDEFSYLGGPPFRPVAPRPFLARLPQRLLADGALAAIGHVERALEISVEWQPGAGRRIQAFEVAFERLMQGYPVGAAIEPFGLRYARLSSDLNAELEAIRYGTPPDDAAVADLWTASHDARNYVVLGDPAVRVARPEDLV